MKNENGNKNKMPPWLYFLLYFLSVPAACAAGFIVSYYIILQSAWYVPPHQVRLFSKLVMIAVIPAVVLFHFYLLHRIKVKCPHCGGAAHKMKWSARFRFKCEQCDAVVKPFRNKIEKNHSEKKRGLKMHRMLHGCLIAPVAFGSFFFGGVSMVVAGNYLQKHFPDARFFSVAMIIMFLMIPGWVVIAMYLFGKIPVRCPYCGGKSFMETSSESANYNCVSCKRSFEAFTMSPGFKWPRKTHLIWQVPLLAAYIFVFVIFILGYCGPALIALAFAYLLISIPVRILVSRKKPKKAPSLLIGEAATDFFLAAAIVGAGRGLAYFFISIVQPDAIIAGLFPLQHFGRIDLRFLEIFVALCGIVYAVTALIREGSWRFRQSRQINKLITTKTIDALPGPIELNGTARAITKNLDDSIIKQDWGLLKFGKFFENKIQANKFYLEDDTGKILIDPVYPSVQAATPLMSLLFGLFGKRKNEIALTGRFKRDLLFNSSVALREGDPVFAIGRAEENPDANPDATGPYRLIVRPGVGGRKSDDIRKYFLFKSDADDIADEDVFYIADTQNEKKAKRRIYRSAMRYVAWGFVWAFLSAFVIAAPYTAGTIKLALSSTASSVFPIFIFNDYKLEIDDVEFGGAVEAGVISIKLSEPALPRRDEQFWVTVIKSGEPDSLYGSWSYVTAGTSIIKLPMPAESGNYEVRLHARYPKFSTNVIWRYGLFLPGTHPAGGELLPAEDDALENLTFEPFKERFSTIESPRIRFSKPLPDIPDERYWLTIVQRDTSDTTNGSWIYVPAGATEATLPNPGYTGLFQIRLHAKYPAKSHYVVHRKDVEITLPRPDEVEAEDREPDSDMNATFRTNRDEYTAEQNIIVYFDRALAPRKNESYKLTLADNGTPDTEFLFLQYLGSGEIETTVTNPVKSGLYEIRLFARYPTPEERIVYRKQIAIGGDMAEDLRVGFEIDSTVQTAAYGTMYVRFDKPLAPQNGQKYWLTVVPKGSPYDTSGNYTYMDAGATFAHAFRPETPGYYEIRLHARHPARSYFMIGRKFVKLVKAEALVEEGAPEMPLNEDLDLNLAPATTSAKAGEKIEIVFSKPALPREGEKYWVTVAPVGSADGSWGLWQFVKTGATEMEIEAPDAPGNYEIRLHARYPKELFFVISRSYIAVQ